jgi:hypothetical protein
MLLSDAATKAREWKDHPAQMVEELFGVKPDAWQAKVLEAFPHQRRIAMRACAGPGKGQTLGCIIDTPLGSRVWGSLQPGDLVFAEDGSPTEIRRTFPLGVTKVYRVTFDDGSSTVVTDEHLWKVRAPGTLGWDVLTTDHIFQSGQLPEIPAQGAVDWPHNRLIQSAYYQGMWLRKSIPQPFKYSSIRQRKDLLAALLYMRGTIRDDGYISFTGHTNVMASDVAWVVRSLGGKATVSGPHVIMLLPFDPFHDRGRWGPPRDQELRRRMVRIEPAGYEDSMCIEVAHPSHCYLANDFIVTHNTAVLAWLGWNFALTRPHSMTGCTSITGDNLKTGLWTELARWSEKSKGGLLQKLFTQTKSEIFLKEHPKTWRIESRSWAKDADAQQIGNALAGVHADYVMWLLDETGDYPESIMPVCEGIFNGSPIEAHIVQAGNPTRLDGPLYRACTVARDIWHVVTITADPDDPDRTPRVSVATAMEQIKQYGRDHPYVMVRILGQFPPSSFNALIGPEEVRQAQQRFYKDLGNTARIMGVDVARYGDDSSTVARRQGLQLWPFITHRNINSVQGASIVNREWQSWGADACFVDDTGGFGAGWIDQLHVLNRSPIGVGYAREAHDKTKFYNKRAEMYFDAVEWIKKGGALPANDKLLAALTQTTYTFKGGRFLLEPKEDVKARLGYSPDEADAFVMTFAEPVQPSAARMGRPAQHVFDHDPFAEVARNIAGQTSDYDPFR